MSNLEIVGIIVSIFGVGCFATVFTILYVTYSNSLVSEYKSGKRDMQKIKSETDGFIYFLHLMFINV